jgi:hypothetical protein
MLIRNIPRLIIAVLFSTAFLVGCHNGSSPPDDDNGGAAVTPKLSDARSADTATDLLTGPLARSRIGDYVLENERIRVIIQKPGRSWFGIGTFGGNIIDASVKNSDGSFNPDHLEEFVTGINIENVANYTQVDIRNDGSDAKAAIICFSGPDDLLELVNASTTIRALGASFPESADDRDLPLEIETCYSLEPDENWVTIDTTLRNTAADPLAIYMTEYLSGSGEVEAFQPNAGFGEPQGTRVCAVDTQVSCGDGLCDQCNYFAYTGNGGADGVSYGLIHEESGSTSFSTSGVSVLILGQAVIDLIFLGQEPNFDIPGEGELTLRRYFALGDGSASSIADIRNIIFGIETGDLSGTVTSGGDALGNAEVAIFQTVDASAVPPQRFMAGHIRTDADGNYSLTLPPGEYEVQAHLEGYLYANEEPAIIEIVAEQASEQSFDLPAPGFLHVDITEVFSSGPPQSTPAKVQLVGVDPSPPLLTSTAITVTGVFGDNAEQLPYGITLVEFVDRSGSSNVVPVEPGEYQLVVSRGPRYSAFKQNVSIVSGETSQVDAQITQVVETPSVVYGDFHVHSIDSPDSEVTREERVATYLAEGVDFFTPSDHGIRVDFTETLMAMDVADLIGTAPSGEITTFDYGHFNSWPVTTDASLISGGSTDWGREAAPGMDFPAYGSYGLSPAEIYSDALADPKGNIVQINHITAHFGGSGLAIDTGMTPPQSQNDPSEKRLDPNLENGFDDGFQALEVWIGADGRSGIYDRFLGQNAGDWFNLINQGIVRTGVANSDTHDRRITYLATRNLIASAETDPGNLSALAEQLAATVAAGKIVGSNGPFMTIEATASMFGVTRMAGLGVNQSTTVSVGSGNSAMLKVTLSTPAWAALDAVDFYVNNQPELTTPSGEAARYGICANYTVRAGDEGWESTDVIVLEGVQGASRTDITVSLRLPEVSVDTWVVAVARGTDGVSEPMFPVVPEDLARDSNQTLADLTDGNLDEKGMLAFAFTNPLFLDAGGNGWVAPGVANASCP